MNFRRGLICFRILENHRLYFEKGGGVWNAIIYIDRKIDRHTDKQTDRHTQRHTDRQASRQTDRSITLLSLE